VLDAAEQAGAAGTALHCCAADPPVPTLVRADAGALSLDVSLLGAAAWESVAVAVEGGVALWAGAVPATGPPTRAADVADAVWNPWRKLGLDAALLSGVVVTPACGLAGSSPAGARATLTAAKDGASALAERAADG
jgi:hypothetical protein